MSNLGKPIYTSLRAGIIILVISLFTIPMIGIAAADKSSTQANAILAPGQHVNGGLTSLVAVPKGINGSFVAGSKVIHFETRRGPQTPRYLRAGDPTAPIYEIDVRFLDEDGNPYLVQIGGDRPIDPTWSAAAAKYKVDSEAKSDFDLTAKSIETIKKLKFNNKYKPEQLALINLASTIEEAQVVEKVEAAPLQIPNAQATLPVNSYRHKIEIRHKSCCFGLGRHSATIGKYISITGVTTTAVITCNHGTCANQMALKCSWTSASPGNRTTRLNNNIACTTPYNPTSIFGHNSNDDTDLQYRAVRYNIRPSTSSGVCNDSSVNNEPTHCY